MLSYSLFVYVVSFIPASYCVFDIANVVAEIPGQTAKDIHDDSASRKSIIDSKVMYNRQKDVPQNGQVDGSLSEQFAETFLSRFLDTKRIEDFVRPIPAGQEVLQVIAAVRVSDANGNIYEKLDANPWEFGKDEEILVGLRNKSKTSSAIVFGIISNLSNPKKPSEILQKVYTFLLDLLHYIIVDKSANLFC